MTTPQVPTPREQRLAVLATPIGIGEELAARLLDHVGSLRAARMPTLAREGRQYRSPATVGGSVADALAALIGAISRQDS